MAKRGQALRKARPVKRPAKAAVDLKQENAALKRELVQAVERQTATTYVLKIISGSTFDLEPVFHLLMDGNAAMALR